MCVCIYIYIFTLYMVMYSGYVDPQWPLAATKQAIEHNSGTAGNSTSNTDATIEDS